MNLEVAYAVVHALVRVHVRLCSDIQRGSMQERVICGPVSECGVDDAWSERGDAHVPHILKRLNRRSWQSILQIRSRVLWNASLSATEPYCC